METLYTLQQIKVEWERTLHTCEYTSFDKFLMNNYVPNYNDNLDFIGFTKDPTTNHL